MPPELKAAYIVAQSTAAYIQCQSMIAANQEREREGQDPAYFSTSFTELSCNLRILTEKAME